MTPAVPPHAPSGLIDPHTPDELAATAAALAARPELWEHLIEFTWPDRTHVRFAGGDGWEAWLITWMPGQRTRLHNHGPCAGAFRVVRGTLTEDEALETPVVGHPLALRRRSMPTGSHRRFGPGYVHDVLNVSEENAVSIHVYHPALVTMVRWVLDDDGLLQVWSQEKVGVDF